MTSGKSDGAARSRKASASVRKETVCSNKPRKSKRKRRQVYSSPYSRCSAGQKLTNTMSIIIELKRNTLGEIQLL